MFGKIAQGLTSGRRLFTICTPAPTKCIKVTSKLGKVFKIIDRAHSAKKLVDIDSVEKVAETVTRGVVGGQLYRRVNKAVTSSLKHASECTMQPWFNKKNGIGGRSWIKKPEDGKRMIKRIKVVYHDADKAGKHLDIHIGHLSLVINIDGKPISDKIKFDSNGELTAQSKADLVELLRDEIKNKSRMIQNLDHSVRNAESSWPAGTKTVGYGAGKTRQKIMDCDVEILSVNDGSGQSVKMYAPDIDSHKMLYIHKVYYGNGKKPPVVIFGSTNNAPKFEDKLHLKKADNIDEFKRKVSVWTVTRKYDGASAHGKSSRKNTIFVSPRIDQHGNSILYHIKLPELYRVGHGAEPMFIGELLLKERFNPFLLRHWLNDRYLTAAQIGGVLNAHKLRPRNLIPEFRIYRMDKWKGENVINTSYFYNRALQSDFAKSSRFIKLPAVEVAKVQKGIEGLVGVPKGSNILNGYAIKFWDDPDDWEVTSVDLKYGPTGRTAGVVNFKSLESGKSFKLGPGQLGTESDCLVLMQAGNKLVGQVAKVKSRRGHEGRSAKFVEWHLDKGTGH